MTLGSRLRLRFSTPTSLRQPSLFQPVSAPSDKPQSCHPSAMNQHRPLSTQDFFRYTRGRFLFDKDIQLKERYKEFNVAALQDVVVQSTSSKQCIDMVKLGEGSFNKVFLLTMDSGKEVVARIPHPNAGSKKYTTASEVATLHFLRTRLDFPVPRVLTYSCDNNNLVGSEYIVMERIKGPTLGDKWESLTDDAKVSVVQSIARLQSRLLNCPFSYSGNLYFIGDVHPSLRAPQLYDAKSPDDQVYCIGPSSLAKFWDLERSYDHLDRGPCNELPFPHHNESDVVGRTASDYWSAICRREIEWIQKFATPRPRDDPLRQVDSQEEPQSHIKLLTQCLRVAPYLDCPPPASTPVLWPDDISFQNVIVSEDPTPTIVSVLDWQNVAIGPLHLRFCEPEFLTVDFQHPSNDESEVFQRTLLPEERLTADEIVRLRNVYLKSILDVYPALDSALSLPFREMQGLLIADCGRSWEKRNGILSLRQGLINISRNWNKYGLTPPAPISFSAEELAIHLEEGQGYNGNSDFIQTIINGIGMSPTGEVSAEEFDVKMKEYEDTKQRWIEMMNEQVAQAGISEKIDWEVIWPFRYPGLGF